MTRSRMLVGFVVLGVALSGCASQGTPTSQGAAATTAVATPPPTATATPTGTTTAATPEPDPFTPVDPADYTTALSYARGGGVDFDSPSRMLHCGILDYGDPGDDLKWGCTVPKHSWQVPHSSPGDFCYEPQIPCGNGIEATGAKLPQPQMRSDTIFAGEGSAVAALPYGNSITFAGVTCESAESGLTCRHAGSKHGFTLSDSAYEIW